MNNLNLSPDKMNSLLKMAGQKLGKNPDDIKAQLENGNLDQVISGLDPNVQSKISALAKDPKAVEALMKNNNVQNLLSGLMGGNK